MRDGIGTRYGMGFHPSSGGQRMENLTNQYYEQMGTPGMARLRYHAASANAQVAQLVEHATENRSVGGSTPPLGTFAFSRLADGCGNRGRPPGNQAVLAACLTRSGKGRTAAAPGTCKRSPR